MTDRFIKAMLVEKFGPASAMKMGKIDVPEPRIGEVCVSIKAAGVNPLEAIIRAGYGEGIIPASFPFIPGHDFAGTVCEVGEGCSRFAIGDDVYGYTFPNVIKWGAYAEKIVVPELWLGKKPKSISFVETAAFPIPALTTIQLLDGWARIKKGETILIHAGAGGVGSFAVQYAKHKGLSVIATASSHNHEYLRELGADTVIDYNTQDFVEVVKAAHLKGIDIVLFTISIVDNDFHYGEQTLFRSIEVLKGGGKIGSGSRLASIVNMAPQEPELRRRNINYTYISARPNGPQLNMLSDLIDEGNIRPPKITTFPFEDAVKAHELIETKHASGKIVIEIN